MEKYRLVPHPETPSCFVTAVEVELTAIGPGALRLSFAVVGNDRLVVPDIGYPERGDELWTATCFELFVRRGSSEAYDEYNFSPSRRWAAYAFDGYRVGMREADVNVEPHIAYDDEGETGTYVSIVELDLMNASGDPLHIGLSAVIEEEGGRKSYWALAHPPGPPDFHHPDCFTLELAAPKRT